MQLRKIASAVTLFCFICCMYGCYTNRYFTPTQLEAHQQQNIHKIVTDSGDVYIFPDGARLIDDMISGYTNSGEFVEIPKERINIMYVRKFDVMKTGLYTLGCASLAGFIYLSILLYALMTMDW